MDRLYNTRISVYATAKDNVGKVCTMRQFLFSSKYKAKIEAIRQCPDELKQKEMKKYIPAASLSGVFSPTRHATNLVQHSGYICIDIDADDNPHLDSPQQMLAILRNRPEVMYAALSIRGKGYFAIIPLAYPELHLQQFQQLMIDYEAVGLKLDAACKDVCRIRFVSLDEHPYTNPQATAYTGIYREQRQEVKPVFNGQAWGDMFKVQRCCQQIYRHQILIASHYDEMFAIGASLSSLGEEGRQWCHLVFSMHPNYNAEFVNKKFDEFLKNVKQFSIGTFFYHCQQYGINYSNPIE